MRPGTMSPSAPARAIGSAIGEALGAAILFAFATPHLPIHAGGLWNHNASMVLCLSACDLRAADASPEFVGILAYAASPADAQALGLDNATHQELLKLIDKREQQALQMTLDMKELSPAQMAAKLGPFVAESEQMGLELLSREQRAKLLEFVAALLRKGLVTATEAAPTPSPALRTETAT